VRIISWMIALGLLGSQGTAAALGEVQGDRVGLCREVITELLVTLDHAAGGAVAANLRRLWELLLHHLMLANAERSLERLDEVLAVYGPIADAFRWFERYLSFELHDTTGPIAAYGYSASYFVIFPALCLYVTWALARHRDPRAYQAVSLAVAIDYAISLPFFLFFPVPERWSSPMTEAMLLSDKVSDKLIEYMRPLSGLDNCFPSFHVSLTVLVVAACFLFRVPLRMAALALGGTIVLSTFVLGVHWIPDMIAGVAVGIASLLLAWRIVQRGRSPFLLRYGSL